MNRRIARTAQIGALVLALVLVPAALAAKGGGSAGGGGKPPKGGGTTSTGTINALVLVDPTSDGLPHWNHTITFNVSTTATSRPQVGLRCYQGSNWVFDAYVGYFPGYMFDPWFNLQSNYWVDGVPATCNARLFYNDRRGRQIVLTTMSFPVAP